ncbi:uncharacterized protein LOC143082742 [Mytilus galloprovincialis]|uniref:uncharacterized protein LOC143082742 n=1 Tax=Mytilus galloprovincialis TaxID=29158 RepID=UPI003F7B6CAB
MVELLLRKNANVDCADMFNVSALQYAASGGHSDVVQLLLLHDAIVNQRDISGQTALHRAAINGSVTTVQTLLEGGAKKKKKDKTGKTPYDLAVKYRHEQVQTLIQDFKSKTKTKSVNSASNTPTKHFPFPGMSDEKEFIKLISKGTFESYENRVFLAGPCNSGKSSLASILIGEKVVTKWRSTDGLIIYFGRNGILLSKRKMIPLQEGKNEIILKLLRGKPNLIIEDTSVTHDISSAYRVDHVNTVQPNATQMHTADFINADISTVTEINDTTKLKQQEVSKPEDEHRKISQRRQKSHYTGVSIHKDVLKQLKKGKFKMEIAPSDLVDFGGQRSFDMTHQLFIQHKGTFVLIFDGSTGLYEPLKEYPHGNFTAASILTHWVNSILAYCGDSDDKMPMIVFAASHSDYFKDKELKRKTKEYTEELTKMFSIHKHSKHIVYGRVFFINATNSKDLEIEHLTDHLVEIAFQQPTWGERKPIAWVPLELVISEMKSRDVKLMTKAEMKLLNESHNDFVLNDIQFEHFLKIQHSLGKILYFALPGIDDFIVLQPPAMVNILRSFVTDECFWPKQKHLAKIHKDLHDSGSIKKSDLFQLWNQKPFTEIMPDEKYKEYILQVLIHLDILIEPKRQAEKQSIANEYLVPCFVKATAPANFLDMDVFGDRTLCIAYEMTDLAVPSALSFKLIAAALVVWPLKEENGRPCLYYQSALMNVDERNELRILIDGQHVMVYLTNAESIHLISPDLAASIQECITLALTSALKFYLHSFGKVTVNLDVSRFFNIKVGLICDRDVCLVPLSDIKLQKEWTCKHEVKHLTKYPMYWIFDKKNELCSTSCRGLESDALKLAPKDQHLVRLAKQIEDSVFEQFLIHLGLTSAEWEGVVYQYDRNGEVGKKLMALYEWKKKREAKLQSVELELVSKALIEVDRQHYLCKIVREDTCLIDIADSRLQEIPADEVLNRLPKHIGNCVIQLGIELGLSFNSIEETMHNHFKDMYSQIYDILKKWKQSSRIKPTIYLLMVALQRTDSGGLTFLRDEYFSASLNSLFSESNNYARTRGLIIV